MKLYLFFLPLVYTFPLHSMKYSSFSLKTKKNPVDFPSKFQHFKQLIRSESILPTSLLCFTGGFIMNPSLQSLFQTPAFIISSINTILIMSSSMIINDIFDIKNDLIDHPHRPLVNGNITISEAIGYLIGLLSITEILSIRFLPENLQNIVHLSIINIFLYTPIYKKIPFIKNIFCAIMISFSLFFSGLSATKGLMATIPNFSILSIALSILFFASWYNELLLDMTDIIGDRENRIYTVPVIYGQKPAWLFSGFLLFFNILSNSLSLSYLFGKWLGMILPCIFSSVVYDYFLIEKESYSKISIKNAVKNTRKQLFILVLFLCGLTGFFLNFPTLIYTDIHWLHIATTVFI